MSALFRISPKIIHGFALSRVAQGIKQQPSSRGISNTSVTYSSRSLIKLKKLQADYQCEDGKPIWLKGGFCDKILYGSTIILCYVGVLNVLVMIYEHAKPPTWRTSC